MTGDQPMIEHAWLAPDEDGEVYVVRIERRAPLADGEVKLFRDGSRTVRPVEDEATELAPGQRLGPVAYRIEADRVVRYRPAIDRPLDDVRADRLAAIREEAGDRILVFAPMYRQTNALRAMWADDDVAREDAVALFDRVDAVRDACNMAEDAILAAKSAEEIEAITARWPE